MLIALTLFFGESVTGARTMRSSLRRSSCTTPLQKALKPHLRLTAELTPDSMSLHEALKYLPVPAEHGNCHICHTIPPGVLQNLGVCKTPSPSSLPHASL
ncbi:hypothetical protein BD309DRAFT_975618 [Dichomitus squalens]|nr:hypothetical protein BD309DRAFT_975618 [Dichomitus squalens]